MRNRRIKNRQYKSKYNLYDLISAIRIDDRRLIKIIIDNIDTIYFYNPDFKNRWINNLINKYYTEAIKLHEYYKDQYTRNSLINLLIHKLDILQKREQQQFQQRQQQQQQQEPRNYPQQQEQERQQRQQERQQRQQERQQQEEQQQKEQQQKEQQQKEQQEQVQEERVGCHTVLGVEENASDNDIRKAYYRLALKWHPDKKSHPQADLNFIKIQKAKTIMMEEDPSIKGNKVCEPLKEGGKRRRKSRRNKKKKTKKTHHKKPKKSRRKKHNTRRKRRH